MARKKVPLVPKLRFPEFMGEPGWEANPLDRLAARRTKRNDSRSKLRTLTNSAEFGVVDQRDFFEKDIATNTENYFVVDKGDFVYNPRISNIAPVGPISKNRIGSGVVSPLYTIFRFKNDDYDFFAQYFLSSHWHPYLRKVSNSGARHDRMAITNDDFMAMPIPLPPTEAEQQKIAGCLGSLDDLIAAEARKLDALRQHKKGLIQQLLPRPERIKNGKKIPAEVFPRLRFQEFKDVGEWEERKLGDLGQLVSGLTYSPADIRDEGLLVLRSSNIQNQQICLDDCVYVRPDINGANSVQQDDILICVRNGSKALIGKNAIIPQGMPACTHGAFMTVFRAAAPHFMRVLLQSSAYKKQVAADLGATINSINGKQLLKYRFMVPKRAEQSKIANLMAFIDREIHSQSQKIDALKLHKRGLLQQLFPSLEGH